MDDLASAVTQSGGQPATLRVGTVVRVTPSLQIDLGGTILNNEAIGYANGWGPGQVGEIVALLGQSVEGADTSGSTWLVLGGIGREPAGAVSATDNGPGVVTASGAFVASGGGGAALGRAFVAPASGKVMIFWNLEITPGAAAFALCSPQVAAGAVIAAGTVHPGWAANFDRTRRNDNSTPQRGGASDLCEGLTPGAVYNVTLYYATSGVAATFGRRSLAVVPA